MRTKFLKALLITLAIAAFTAGCGTTDLRSSPSANADGAKREDPATNEKASPAASMDWTPEVPINPRAVEAEARAYPSAPPPKELPEGFRKKVPGTSRRECVEVGDEVAVRSGEFVAGSFRTYVDFWKPNPKYGKLWWAPLHLGEYDPNPELTVRTVRLDKPSTARAYRFSDVGAIDNAIFYPSSIPLPTRGTWRLVATSGADWGCFDLTLK